MEVTRDNFEQALEQISQDVRDPSCQLIAIDTEFTGLSISEEDRENYMDTLEERYRKLKLTGDNFLVTQIGFATVHFHDNSPAQSESDFQRVLSKNQKRKQRRQQLDEESRAYPEVQIEQQTAAVKRPNVEVKSWNFFVFPRASAFSDERFLCQASSLQFLSDNGFDFNKFIAKGIPYVRLSELPQMKSRAEKRMRAIDRSERRNSSQRPGAASTLIIRDERDRIFQQTVERQLDEWIKDVTDDKLVIEARNNFHRLIVHDAVQRRGPKYYSESVRDGVQIRYVTVKERREIIEDKKVKLWQDMEQSLGFSRVIQVIQEAKKPLVGHNCLLDFVYLFRLFYRPLPETLDEFKMQLLELFPTIYDTKHMVLSAPELRNNLRSTSLESLFEYLRNLQISPPIDTLLSKEPVFDGYRNALGIKTQQTYDKKTKKDASLNEESGEESELPGGAISRAKEDTKSLALCHEAGFDALLTSMCFVGLLHHDAQGVLVNSDGVEQSEFLRSQMEKLAERKNMLNLMISDGTFVNLELPNQQIDRSNVVHLSSSKRKIHQLDVNSFFKPNKVMRIVYDTTTSSLRSPPSATDAFVFLEEPIASQEEIDRIVQRASTSSKGGSSSSEENSKAPRSESSSRSDITIVPYEQFMTRQWQHQKCESENDKRQVKPSTHQPQEQHHAKDNTSVFDRCVIS